MSWQQFCQLIIYIYKIKYSYKLLGFLAHFWCWPDDYYWERDKTGQEILTFVLSPAVILFKNYVMFTLFSVKFPRYFNLKKKTKNNQIIETFFYILRELRIEPEAEHDPLCGSDVKGIKRGFRKRKDTEFPLWTKTRVQGDKCICWPLHRLFLLHSAAMILLPVCFRFKQLTERKRPDDSGTFSP